MLELTREWRILEYIDKSGPQTFSELVDSDILKLSRNTVNKYLRNLRGKNWVSTKYEEDRKLNYLTTDGKIELEKKLGKGDVNHQIKAYYLYEQKIKEYRDGFLERLGELPNSLLMDCIEYFVEFENYKFSERMPSKDFQYYLSYFLARYDLQYCKSEGWVRRQTAVMQYTQEKFIDEYKLDKTDIDYFSKEWGKIKSLWPIMDQNNRIWYLSYKSKFYEILMMGISMRARRGTLQELVFDNWTLNINEEAVYLLGDNEKNLLLKFDHIQTRQLLNFIERMMNGFLESERGFKVIWVNLPNNPEALLSLSVDYETELNQIQEDSPRKLELLRASFEINLKLNNHEEALAWGEKLLKLKPKDMIMPLSVTMEYLYLKKYNKFLQLANKLREENKYDVLVRMSLVKYFLEVESNVDKALEIVGELDEILIDNPNLMHFYMIVEFYKAKIYFLMDQLDYAKIHAERVWYEYQDQSDEVFSILFEIYKKLEDWEILEDFSLNAYTNNRFSPTIFCNLYYAHLKRQSFQKAQHIHDYVNQYYPEYIAELERIKKDFR